MVVILEIIYVSNILHLAIKQNNFKFSQDYRVGRKEIAAEFSQYELDRYSKPEPRTEFKSKVEEDIYRAKKHLLKTRGGWD